MSDASLNTGHQQEKCTHSKVYLQENLKAKLHQELKDLTIYQFSRSVRTMITNIAPRYLFNEGILEDIDKIRIIASDPNEDKYELSMSPTENIDEEGFLIEDQTQKNIEKEIELEDSEENSLRDRSKSFYHNKQTNKSLIVQIDIIYGQDETSQKHSLNLKLFLKWVQAFKQHLYGGFLKPIYAVFYQQIENYTKCEFDELSEEVCVFVQFMVKVYTWVYQLPQIYKSSNGHLFKNDNIYNLVMSCLFKYPHFRQILKSMILQVYQEQRALFKQKIEEHCMKQPSFFQVEDKFRLNQDEDKKQSMPYRMTIKLLEDFCRGVSPLTKLKIIVEISKSIMRQINEYYKSRNMVTPEMDPDNLISIVTYLMVRNNNAIIYEELKIVQQFTTSNCLKSISGYYLNVLSAAVQIIIKL